MGFSRYFLDRLKKRSPRNKKFKPQVAAFYMTSHTKIQSHDNSRFYNQFLPIAKLQELAEDVTLKTSWYYLYGDPFDYPWIMAFIGAIKRNRRSCLVRSSPKPLRKNAHLLSSLNVDVLQMEIPCQPFSSEDLACIRQVAEICEGKKEQSLHLELSIILDNYKPGMLSEMVRSVESTGADAIIFSHLEFNKILNRIYDRSSNPARCLTDDEVLFPLDWSLRCEIEGEEAVVSFGKEYPIKALAAEIESLKALESPIKIEFYPDLEAKEILNFYKGREANFSGCHCPAHNWTEVLPNGNVIWCHDFPEYISGNVYDSDLKSIYKSTASRFFFTALNQSRSFSMCSYCCLYYMNTLKR